MLACNAVLVFALIHTVGLSCGKSASTHSRPKPSKEVKLKLAEPDVQFEYKLNADSLEINYFVSNRSDGPIFIFDRLWNMETQSLDHNWVYVDIEDRVAILKRQMELLPRGLRFENPPVPYARELLPGQRATARFKVGLPLVETGPYDHIVKRGERRDVAINKLEFRLGWCPKPIASAIPPGVTPVEINGELLWLLPYGLVANLQIVTRAPQQPIELTVHAVQ